MVIIIATVLYFIFLKLNIYIIFKIGLL